MVVFKLNGICVSARQQLANQAQKALYALYRKLKNANIPVDLEPILFDSLVTPILFYASEVCGYERTTGL